MADDENRLETLFDKLLLRIEKLEKKPVAPSSQLKPHEVKLEKSIGFS